MERGRKRTNGVIYGGPPVVADGEAITRDECDLLDKNVDIGSTRLTDSNESIVCHRESPSVHCRVQGFLLSDILFYFIAKRMTKGRAWKLWTFISQLLF